MEKFVVSKKIQILVIVLVTFLAYSNIFQNDFVWDDIDFIPWAASKDLGSIINFFLGEAPQGHTGVYRPVRSMIYAASYELWKSNPIGYHFQSILIHLISTILVYFIVTEISKKSMIAFVSSLIFGVHSIHTEAITSITASFDVFGAVFLLASFYLYIKASPVKNYLYMLSLVFAVLSFFTYEFALVLPLLIVLHDLCIKKESNLLKRVKVYAPYFAGAFLYFFIRFFVLEISNRGQYFANSFYHTMLIMAKAFLKYILLLIFPINLSVNHSVSEGILSYAYIDLNEKNVLAQSIFDFHILVSIAVIMLLAVIAILSFRKYPLVSFCIGWFFIALAPVSNILPQSVIMAEKYLYIASFGFALLFSFVVYTLYTSFDVKYLRFSLILFLIFTLIFYSAVALDRNKDWKDQFTLWSKTVQQSPGSALAHNNLGLAYESKGMLDLAIEEYRMAILLNPSYDKTHNNLGVAYQIQGNLDLAIQEYRKAIEINPNRDKNHNNLGAAYQAQGKLDLAIEEYRKAIELNPDNQLAKHNLNVAMALVSR